MICYADPLQAELRANVFKAIDEQEQSSGVDNTNPRVTQFRKSAQGLHLTTLV